MKETRIEIRKKCEDGVVNIVDNDNNPIGSQTVESGEVETFVVTDLPCSDATVTNGTTYTDTIPSGMSLLLPTENITVNGNLLVIKLSVEDYNVEVVDSDDNPTGVISGGKVVVADSKEWILQFIDQTVNIRLEATPNNITTFTSGVGTDVGTIEVSNDGVTYSPLSFPFSPSVGTWYFKRSSSLATGSYTISE